ncbi:hypothetical protein MMC07_003613 [Pseudocyphellaria aurata]|nr:hypothetical protein [Pseudocyphellaria aurata]
MSGSERSTSPYLAAWLDAHDNSPPITEWLKDLPTDVLLIIFGVMEKSQLKTVRRVCKFFCRLTSPLLFDEIYISPHERNLDVFRKISNHPELCYYPRKLVYDVQEFNSNIGQQEYYASLCQQLYVSFHDWPESFNNNIPGVAKDFLLMVSESREPAKSNPNSYAKHSTCRPVKQGLERYLQMADEAHYYLSTGEFAACLSLGLTRLNHVDIVEFQDCWTTQYLTPGEANEHLRDRRSSSGPLARAWSIWYLQPELPATITPEFEMAIMAFSLTRRPLRLLKTSPTLRVGYDLFKSNQFESYSFYQHGISAMRSLESLSLKIETRDLSLNEAEETVLEDPSEKTQSVDLLAAALRQMPGLRRLSLKGCIGANGNGLLSIYELFDQLTLPALERLNLSGMLGCQSDVSAFLQEQPRLRDLTLQEIELRDGTWADLVEDMRRFVPLNSLTLRLPLRDNGEGMLRWTEANWEASGISESIECYVLHGGENPLRRPVPSENYVDNIC